MSDHHPNLARNPYPMAEGGPLNDPTPRDQAIYVPAASSNYIIDAHDRTSNKWSRVPQGVTPDQMDYLDPSNPLFRISHVLYSAGQALMSTNGQIQALPPNIITSRNRNFTRLLVDSGGFQIAKGRPWINAHRDRLDILRWMEAHGDLGMTLDVPPGPVGVDPDYQFKSFAECLSSTLDHLGFFRRYHRPGRLKLLTVLHGRNQAEADQWYDACKVFPFGGWAFGGVLRHDFHQLCRRILIMEREGQIQDKCWIHILGTCELETAVVLTGLQRSINRHVNPNLRISFDTASPAIAMSRGKAYTIPSFDRKTMAMPTKQAPDGLQFVGSGVRWPWPSPLGDRMVMGDMCVRKRPGVSSNRDTISNHFLTHHNLGALCWGIALANRIFDAEGLNHAHTIAPHVGAAVEAIDEILRAKSESRLLAYQHTLSALKYTNPPNGADEERDVY